ncbi:hypothetical protein [Flexivirga alba]|uniref:Uncharacterized protein n=1 Tax=Flexivirga alba TaxID=702742 RepID=A0ABW2ALN4_9MICO
MTWNSGQESARRQQFRADLKRAFEAAGVPVAGERAPSVEEFRAVGLSEADARAARDGLTSGMYLSVEDAAVSRETFGMDPSTRLDDTALRELTEKFSPGVCASDEISESEFRAAMYGTTTEGDRR